MGIERLYADGIEQAYQRGLRSPAPQADPDFRLGSFLAAGMGGFPRAAMETLGSVRDFSRGIDEQYRASPRGQIVARELERRTGVAPADQVMMPGGDAQRMKAREFAPDPQTAHMADQVFHGLTRFGAKAVGAVVAAGPVGGAALLGTEETNTIYRDLIGRGIDSETALKVAAIQGGISAAGVMLPISGASMAATTAGKVGATAGLVAAGGPGAYVAQETLARDILQRAGYADEAAKHDPTDPIGLVISTLLPAAFGGVALRGALRSTAPMPSVKTEAGVRQAVQLTPEEQAASAEFERSAGNLAELRKEIARTKDPALRQILEAELATQTQAAANAGRGAVAPMPAVYSKDVPPPGDGMVRLYRAESPTVRFGDVFDASQLGQFKRPAGMTGDRYTDEFKLADYYRKSYGRDAVIQFVDVPKESLAGRGGAAGEYFVDTAVSVDRRRTAQAAAMSPEVVDAARVKVLQETVQKSLPQEPEAYPRLMEAIDEVAAGRTPQVPDFIPPAEREANFAAWFGESRATEWGKKAPAVKYHGTAQDVPAFDVTRAGSRDDGDFGAAIYVSDNPEVASRYATRTGTDPTLGSSPVRDGGNVMPVYIKAERPLILYTSDDFNALWQKAGGDEAWFDRTPQQQAEFIQSLGYDSVWDKKYGQWAVFRPEQVKSATGNSGRFDPNSPSLTDPLTARTDASNPTQAANPEAAAPARGAGTDAPPGAAEPGRSATDVQAAGVARTMAQTERQIVDTLATERPDMMVTLPGTNEAVRLADAVEMIRAQQALDESDADLVRAAVLCDLSP